MDIELVRVVSIEYCHSEDLTSDKVRPIPKIIEN